MYSYGVILWELVTHKIPWDNLNTMQVLFFAMCLSLGYVRVIHLIFDHIFGDHNVIVNLVAMLTSAGGKKVASCMPLSGLKIYLDTTSHNEKFNVSLRHISSILLSVWWQD